MKRPAFQFYPGDWLRSTDLRSVSVGARGLWIEMICLMHEGQPYGYLRVGNKGIDNGTLARISGCSVSECDMWTAELLAAGVCSKEGDTYLCRRMIRDERIRNSRAAGGIKSIEHPNTCKPRVPLTPPLGVPPASASASSVNLKPKPTTAANGHIHLTADGLWEGIKASQIDLWKRAYPAVLIDAELNAAAAWIIANPANKKSNYARFLTNWLKKQQDRAPKMFTQQPKKVFI